MSKKSPPTRADVAPLIELHRTRQYGDAIRAARKFTKKWPHADFGWIMLGACFEALKDFTESARAYRKAAGINPKNPDVLNNLGQVLRTTGDLAGAREALEKALAVNPQHPVAHYNLGLVLLDLDSPEEAGSCFGKAIEINPQFADAHNYLGNIHKGQGRLDEALQCYQQAIQCQPGQAGFHKNMGDALLDKGMLDVAARAFEKAIELDPSGPGAHASLGRLYLRMDEPEKAEAAFRRAAHQQSDPAERHNDHVNLGLALVELGRFAEAEGEYRKALELAPDSAPALHNLGNLVLELGRLDEAEALHAGACEFHPESFTAFRNLGMTRAMLGDREGAESAFRRALEIDPAGTEIYYRLSETRRFSGDDSGLEKMLAMLEEGGLDAGPRAYLHYAAGKAYADMGDMDTSFDHYARGAKYRYMSLSGDVARDEALLRDIEQAFSREIIERNMDAGFETDVPVFIIGMPRSGTTLVEQILSSHADVFGAGERFDVHRQVRQASNAADQPFPDWVAGFSHVQWHELGRRYWSGIRELAGERKKFVDKMPENFRYPGMIAGMLRGARIIHVRRNPLDTCLSCFTHVFEANWRFSCDQVELGRYYRAYARLADHWRGVMPGSMYMEVRYEDLVTSPEPVIRAMLDHCGLPWDPSCLEFHATRRAVSTPSLSQVRRPMYSSSIGRWKAYEKHLQPLIEALGDLARDTG